MKALLRLFNALPVSAALAVDETATLYKPERTIPQGYILMPGLVPSNATLDEVEEIIGISGEKANNSLHKSWAKVRDASDMQLFVEQILHYMTTYGFEALGIYSEDTVFIPAEKLEIPGVEEGISLTVVKAFTKDEIEGSVRKMAESGIALHKDTLTDLMLIIKEFELQINPESVLNRELAVELHQHYGTVPQNPEAFFRYLVFVTTGETLLIKNDKLIAALKDAPSRLLDPIIQKAPSNMGSIFHRFKPLFLALRKPGSIGRKWVNKIRRQAKTEHKPMPVDFLGTLTGTIAQGNPLDLLRLETELGRVNIWRRIRLLYALNFRMNGGSEHIVHKVRNGKAWVKPFDFPTSETVTKMLELAYGLTAKSVIEDLRPNVEGKTYYIPEAIRYALPATEKQFTGNFPTGTSVSVPEDMIFGCHWYDVNRNRIDLDLSTIDITGKKIGWDAAYRNASRSIMFSGDMTSAPKPNGATELFYIAKTEKAGQILVVNYFNHSESIPVPAKLLVASEPTDKLERNYMVDPNHILAQANVVIEEKQNILGFVHDGAFYFSQTSLGNARSVYGESVKKSLEYMVANCVDAISLNDILVKAGATVVHERPVAAEGEDSIEYVDLSPEQIDKTTFLDILSV